MPLKNRLVMVPMALGHATFEDYVTDRVIDWYVERAKGSIALIIVEPSGVAASTADLSGAHIAGLEGGNRWNRANTMLSA